MLRAPFFILASVILFAAAGAQTGPLRQNPALLAELNDQVWIPFSDAYTDNNVDAYLALHAPDFIRVEGDNKRIRNLAEYSTAVRRSFEGWEDREEKAGISFRFLERIVRPDFASERGVYELTLADNEGNVERLYGQFHVIARKLEGRWRIAIDYDSSEGGTIDRAAFLAAAAFDDFKRF